MDNDYLITTKNEPKRLVTGPVLIPDCPDCEYDRGEKTFTKDEVERFVHEYNTKSRLVDEMHIYSQTGETIGYAVENWTLKEPLSTKNVKGDTVNLPVGTWMTTIKITDDQTWSKIEDGTYKGFSAMYLSKDRAEQVLASKVRVPIAQLEDPIPVTISIVDNPCVFDAIFCSIKQEEEDEAVKAGRKISNDTLNKIKGAFESLQNLINDALTERGVEIEANKENNLMEDLSMNEDELKTMIVEAVKEALQTPGEPEAEVEEEPVIEETEPEIEEVEPEPEVPEVIPEAEKKLAAAEKRIKELEEKLGEGESQSIKGQDDTPEPEVAQKFRVEEGRDIYGRKLRV